MVGLADWLPIVKDTFIVVATILATTYATTMMKEKGERIKVYKGFLKEIRQNIHFAEHNILELNNYIKNHISGEILFFRDDFWKTSISGYILNLPSDLQDLLYKIYMKQYTIGEKLAELKGVWKRTLAKDSFVGEIEKEIEEELLLKLNEAQKLLEKKV